jgi:hypothetical protein
MLLAEDDIDVVDLRHGIRHAIAESPESGGEIALQYFDDLWHAANRAVLWHAGTAALLGGISVWGLRRRRDSAAAVS